MTPLIVQMEERSNHIKKDRLSSNLWRGRSFFCCPFAIAQSSFQLERKALSHLQHPKWLRRGWTYEEPSARASFDRRTRWASFNACFVSCLAYFIGVEWWQDSFLIDPSWILLLVKTEKLRDWLGRLPLCSVPLAHVQCWNMRRRWRASEALYDRVRFLVF